MYEVYEFYEGGDLSVLLQTEKCLPVSKALRLFKDLVKAIKVLYENYIIHRDIQPENIFLQSERAVLGDFGNCKQLKNRTDLTEGILGNPLYTSPECLKGMRYNMKTDLFSLGVLIINFLILNF
jgi:serine/threonine protein kinase